MLRVTSSSERDADSLHRPEGGQDIAEFAIVVPILLLLIIGLIEFAVLMLSYNTVSSVAQEGARYGVVHPAAASGTCAASGGSLLIVHACEQISSLKPENVQVVSDLACGTVPGARCISVTVTYQAELLTGRMVEALGGAASIPLSSTAVMEREQ